jgi:hypothetical protein
MHNSSWSEEGDGSQATSLPCSKPKRRRSTPSVVSIFMVAAAAAAAAGQNFVATPAPGSYRE